LKIISNIIINYQFTILKMVQSMSKKTMKGGAKKPMKGGASKRTMKGGSKKVMKGGSCGCNKPMKGGAKKPMKGGSSCGEKKLMYGGAKKPMKGGSSCGEKKLMNGGAKKPMKGGVRKTMKGGSPASDYVMRVCNASGEQAAAPVAPQVKGMPESLSLYQTTGGGKRTKKSKKSKSLNKRGGGATDFRDVLYTRPYDGFRADDAPFFGKFTSQEYLSPAQLINEPNMVANPPFLK
jgi:hypothetical protein